MPDDNKQIEQNLIQDDKGERALRNVRKETEPGKADLVEKQLAEMERLKYGGKSGITDQFGKPVLIGDYDQAAKSHKDGKDASVSGKSPGAGEKQNENLEDLTRGDKRSGNLSETSQDNICGAPPESGLQRGKSAEGEMSKAQQNDRQEPSASERGGDKGGPGGQGDSGAPTDSRLPEESRPEAKTKPNGTITLPEERIVASAPKPNGTITLPEERIVASAPKPNETITLPEERIVASAPKPNGTITLPEERIVASAPKPNGTITLPEERIVASAPKPKPNETITLPEERIVASAPKPNIPGGSQEPTTRSHDNIRDRSHQEGDLRDSRENDKQVPTERSHADIRDRSHQEGDLRDVPKSRENDKQVPTERSHDDMREKSHQEGDLRDVPKSRENDKQVPTDRSHDDIREKSHREGDLRDVPKSRENDKRVPTDRSHDDIREKPHQEGDLRDAPKSGEYDKQWPTNRSHDNIRESANQDGNLREVSESQENDRQWPSTSPPDLGKLGVEIGKLGEALGFPSRKAADSLPPEESSIEGSAPPQFPGELGGAAGDSRSPEKSQAAATDGGDANQKPQDVVKETVHLGDHFTAGMMNKTVWQDEIHKICDEIAQNTTRDAKGTWNEIDKNIKMAFGKSLGQLDGYAQRRIAEYLEEYHEDLPRLFKNLKEVKDLADLDRNQQGEQTLKQLDKAVQIVFGQHIEDLDPCASAKIDFYMREHDDGNGALDTRVSLSELKKLKSEANKERAKHPRI